MKRLLRFPILATMLVLLASCIDMGTPPTGPALSFRQYQPIYMNVSGIEVIEEYKSPMRAPNVEHTMPYSPADAMQIWVKQRLRAAGGNKTMQVIIKDASVIGKDLETGLLSTAPDHQYDARLEVEIRIYGDAALSEASVNVVATRMMTMNNRDSATQRDLKFRNMIKEMMTTTNAELEKNIFQYLGPYVNYTMNP